MHEYNVDIANNALWVITWYQDICDMDKIVYGAKKKQIEDQFAKFVDPKFVQDIF